MKTIEYQMEKEMFNAIIRDRKGADKKINPHKYVIDMINNEYGLLGTVSKIILK